ncbi:ACT domain-containing protein ACR4-like, partial [Bidens hawaiensis]|uniref:ACT domain-containing protein ACR4-like n=1 Tax=Bidens hawaiensis TaxID=980011 RepID=UPI00404BA260
MFHLCFDPIDLQSTQVKTNVSIPVSSKTNDILPNDKDDEHEKLYRILNSLSVVTDNNSCQNATLIQINGINIQEVLLEVVQVLTDIDCIFTKASITSDGSWTMNVFTVTDPEGNKLTHDVNIHKNLGSGTSFTDLIKSVALPASADFTVIELIGSDRPGLLSEVCTVLLDLRCNIMKLNLWTHNTRAAFIILVTDEESGAAVTDPMRLNNIKKRLFCVLTSSIHDDKEANVVVTHGASVQTERRLHQMMLADGDYERGGGVDLEESQRPDVNVVNWYDKYCLVVTIRCADRPRLLFDTICTLTDMNYIVLHGHV